MASSSDISTSSHQTNAFRRLLLPGLVAAIALSVAYVGALIIGKDSGIDGVNGFVLTLSGRSEGFLGGLGLLAPLGIAFAAGMVSAVNPCGFAMLPAYLGLYLGTNEEEGQEAQITRRLGRALMVGSIVTAGFVLLFGVAGVIVAMIGLVGSFSVGGVLPWLGLPIGIGLILAGAWIIGGGKLYTGFAAQAATRMGDPSIVSPKGYFLFGLSYATASLSCTLPIFITIVGISVAGTSILAILGNFFLYALGMGLVIMVLTVGMAIAKGAMIKGVRRALPYIQPVGSGLMVVAGAFIVFYWLTIGGLL